MTSHNVDENGWITVRLDELGVLHCGQSPSAAEVNTAGEGEVYVTGPEQYHDGKIVAEKWTTNPKRIAPEHSIFITVKGSVGDMFKGSRAAIGRDIYAFEPSELVNIDFVYWAIKEGVTKIILNAKGDIPGISKPHILDHTIKFPNRKTQDLLVEKIDVLFAELEAGVASLERAKARLSLYRQSVLKAAFEGRLTADWRAENPDKLEAPEALLKRIQDERAARHKKELDEWQLKLGKSRAGGEEGRKPAKPRKPKVVTSLTGAEIEDLGELPTGWCYAKVAQVAVVGTGVTPLKSNRSFYEPAEVPWVTSGAVNDAFIRAPSSMVSQKALDKTNLRLYPPHTLLVAMYGEGKTRGKCSELLIEATTNQALAALQVSETGSHLRAYLKYFFFKNYQDLRRLASGGVQPNLNMGIIENQPFPLCGSEEQVEIVNRLEATLTNIDALEEQIDTDLARARAMRQSILKRAFSGKLVEQDASDEPASVLLERIKAEKEEARKSKRKRKA